MHKVFTYDSVTGELKHNLRTLNSTIGAIATVNSTMGYLTVKIGKKAYLVHRIAFMYMTGRLPKYIDHINHNRQDNSWLNLREVTSQQNNQNTSVSKNSITKVLGVSSFRDKFRAYIWVDGKQKHIGVFNSIEAASNARKKANDSYGYHENHGK